MLIIKGILFASLLLFAAVWDMQKREIPNLIPVFLFHFFICQSLMLHSSSIYSYIFRKIVSFICIRLNYNMISREMLKISA